MIHPLTPRENLTRPIVGIENRTAHEVFDIMSDRFRAHLTDLASRAGDHTELAKLAEAATPGPWQWVGDDLRSLNSSHSVIVDGGSEGMWIPSDGDAAFIAAANPATVLALLAEIAALRAESENARTVVAWANNSLFGSCCYFHGEPFDGLHLARPIEALKTQATEAERKLAEAVGLVERSIDLMTDEYADTKAYREEVRTFLSKEAERG